MDESIKSEVRSLQKVGGSLALYLPKEWCEANNLLKGSKVNLRYTDEYLCVDVDKPTRSRHLVVDTTSLLEGELKYVLISLYILGYDYVKFVNNKKISLPLRRYIVSCLRHTPDYKVVDEGDNFITIRRIGEGEDLIKALIREFNTVSTVFRYAIDALEVGKDIWSYYDALEELDTEVDKARIEVERASYKISEKPYLNPIRYRHVISSVMISKSLERLADHITLFINEFERPGEDLRNNASQILKELKSKYEELRDIFEGFYLRRHSDGFKDATQIISKLVYIIEGKKSFRDLPARMLQGSANELIRYHLIRIYDYLTDIAEILINVLVDSTSFPVVQ